VNWGWFLLRIFVGLTILTTLFLSQRYWYLTIWRVTSRWRAAWLRVGARLLYAISLALIIVSTADGFHMGQRGHLVPSDSAITIFAGLWFLSAFFAFLAIKAVRAVDRVWRGARRASQAKATARIKKAAQAPSSLPTAAATRPPASVEMVADPSRRYLFRTATALAGAAPFLSAVYGFAAERLNYQVHRVEIPMANLPPALDGLQIAQISDIHLSDYMTPSDVRRAVEMTNELGAHIAVVTGDFITRGSDLIADCVDEVRQLRAPLGVWGCNGNHEIYAGVEDIAERLFTQAGMKLLRYENAQIVFRGAQFNLIGVDYQRERTVSGQKQEMLVNLDSLVRRDMPNILLSHNPNTFNRAAELGIELSLAGHTHGGQIQVEILDHRLSPARFITDYIAGLYQRPLFAPAGLRGAHSGIALANPGEESPASRLYVNRGLGTVGAPVRLGVPPEISLLVLRRA
jgi:uncharacterized protein